MRVLVDGVFDRPATVDVVRVWTSLLKSLRRFGELEFFLLDRGGCPAFAGVEPIVFPSYTASYTATDSLLIQNMCDRYRIDVFVSTHDTTAITTPQVLMVYDMVSDIFGAELSMRSRKEKDLALHYAARLICLSQFTRDELHRAHTKIDPSRSVVAHCGVDHEVFNPQAANDIKGFRQKFNLDKSYIVAVGARNQPTHHRNVELIFDAVSSDQPADYDILFVGGERKMAPERTGSPPEHIRARRLDLSDAELATAYAGAVALVHPSLNDGAGMPVMEAMASGCPVITTQHGCLGEIAGEAALVVSGRERYELLRALHRVREPDLRRQLIQAGYDRASAFDWHRMSECFRNALMQVHEERSDPEVEQFHKRWRKLRSIQADVDIGLD